MILAVAGRRVDPADSKQPRFPLTNVDMVRMRVRAILRGKGAIALVASAACGADLIALSEAGGLGMRRRVVLPFERRRFRETSVTDRPGDWGPLYDQILDEVESNGDLVVLQNRSDDDAYSAANSVILDEALELAKSGDQPVAAVLIWDGTSRSERDLTEEFGVEARKRGVSVTEILTL
jgi:hypothetical protein